MGEDCLAPLRTGSGCFAAENNVIAVGKGGGAVDLGERSGKRPRMDANGAEVEVERFAKTGGFGARKTATPSKSSVGCVAGCELFRPLV